jgi:hypothetical protein
VEELGLLPEHCFEGTVVHTAVQALYIPRKVATQAEPVDTGCGGRPRLPNSRAGLRLHTVAN